jgi:hypothetical protein
MDGISIRELDRGRDVVISMPSSVLAPDVLEQGSFGRHDDSRVPPRHSRSIEPHLGSRIAPYEVLTEIERESTVPPFEPADGSVHPALRTTQRACRPAKRVAETMRRSDPFRVANAVSERGANLCYEVRHVRLDDEGAGPETLQERRLRDDVRPVGDEHCQQLERFWGEMNLHAAARELSGGGIENE